MTIDRFQYIKITTWLQGLNEAKENIHLSLNLNARSFGLLPKPRSQATPWPIFLV